MASNWETEGGQWKPPINLNKEPSSSSDSFGVDDFGGNDNSEPDDNVSTPLHDNEEETNLEKPELPNDVLAEIDNYDNTPLGYIVKGKGKVK